MAGIGQEVHTYLQTVSAVTDLTGTRGYPRVLPQNPTKDGNGDIEEAYTYRVITKRSVQHLTGLAGIAETRIQIDSYAAKETEAAELDEQIRLAMLATPPLTMGSTVVDKVLQVDTGSDEEPPTDGSDNWRYRYRSDYELTHDEATPS